VTPKSPAICGSSESADRTIAWLANPATASSTMALVCEGTGMDEEGASTLYLSDFGGELAGDYIVRAMRRRPLLALMTHVMAAWRGHAHQVIRRASS